MMIDLKKITMLAFLASMMGTSSLLATDNEDNIGNSSISVKPSAPSFEDTQNASSNGNAAPIAPQKESADELRKQMEELKLRIAQREKEEELERKEDELKKKEQELKQREAAVVEREQDKSKTSSQTLEEEKKQAESHQIFNRTPERVAHNIVTELDRGAESFGNLLKHGKWQHKKHKKEKKGKR